MGTIVLIVLERLLNVLHADFTLFSSLASYPQHFSVHVPRLSGNNITC